MKKTKGLFYHVFIEGTSYHNLVLGINGYFVLLWKNVLCWKNFKLVFKRSIIVDLLPSNIFYCGFCFLS